MITVFQLKLIIRLRREGKTKNEINIYEQDQVELLFCNSFHSFPLHSHESWCFGLITEGEVVFKIHNQECLLKRGMLYVIPSNTGVEITAKNKYKYVTVCLKGSLKEAFRDITLVQYFLKLTDVDLFLKPCYDFMWNGDEEKLVQEFLHIMKPLIDISNMQKRQNVSKPVLDAVEYIKNHISEKFDLNNIAEAVNLSKYHLVRAFKKDMGVTPNQYYIQSKLRIVKTELLAEQAGAEIATELNYADQSHLCRQFKRMMGISLQEYKRNMHKK